MADTWGLRKFLWVKCTELPLPPPPTHPDGACMWAGHCDPRGGHPLPDAWVYRPDGTWGRMCPYCAKPVEEIMNG